MHVGQLGRETWEDRRLPGVVPLGVSPLGQGPVDRRWSACAVV
jgi:hypothetical protein